ncbi:MAG: hypothetical protein P1U65_02990 [Minwuia sp.]|nr:hypothetical protein [Minwuia sp.]
MTWFGRVGALLLLGIFASVSFVGSSQANTATEAELWQAVRDGRAVILMRHALAPGTGDPAGFDVNECVTQRNLSDFGRDEARAIGDRLRANGLGQAVVRSSAWCRCWETAELLGVGQVENLQPLDSVYSRPERREPQTAALRSWLVDWQGDQPLIMVSHRTNVRALTGINISTGEMVFMTIGADGDVTVLGTLQ